MNPNQNRLRRAVLSEPVPSGLESRVRDSIRRPHRFAIPARQWIPAAALVAIGAAGAAIAYDRGHMRFTRDSQESYITAISNRIAGAMRPGLGDHVHCAVFRKLPKDAPPVESLAKNMAAEYRGLIPVLAANMGDGYRVVIAHECRHRGRRFLHISLRGEGRLASLIVTRKREGDTLTGLPVALTDSGEPLYRDGVQRFEIASLETREHLAYFVSDLSGGENLRLMASIAPRVREVIP